MIASNLSLFFMRTSALDKRQRYGLQARCIQPLIKANFYKIEKYDVFFFHYKINGKQTIKNSCHSTAGDVLVVWGKAGIPTQLKKHVIAKVENIFKYSQKLKKKNKKNKVKFSKAIEQK